MENVFLKYLSKKVQKDEAKIFEPGPVITISRQYGCYATEIAEILSKNLSKKSNHAWDFITKEILENTAQKLETGKFEIAHIFGADEKTFLSDLMISFSGKHYKSDNLIKRTVHKVVRTYAEQGNCIIVGRAGCIIAKDIPKSVHVKLVAPLEFRVERIKIRFNINEKQALEKIKENDKRRDQFMKYFKADFNNETCFDLILNRASLSEIEIAETIEHLAVLKQLP
jgi:cytidylate kinase